MTFADLGLSDELLRAVNDSGYTEPTPIQRAAIPSVLMGKDLVGIAQTGTGKTAGFVLPMIDILHHGRSRALMPRSMILEPTRELAMQVSENFEKYGKYHRLSMALLIGGVQMGDQIKALEKGVDVLIATPGRLMDLFGRGKILLTGCELLVIDEADRMLDMGFIPDIEEICSKLPKTSADPVLLGNYAATDPETGGQVPERPETCRSRPAGDRERQHRTENGGSWRRQKKGCTQGPLEEREGQERDRLLQSQDDGAGAYRQPSPGPSRCRADPRGHGPVTTESPKFERFKKDEINILVRCLQMSLLAASTSKASATSSTSTCPGSRTIMSTGSAAPAVPVPRERRSHSQPEPKASSSTELRS